MNPSSTSRPLIAHPWVAEQHAYVAGKKAANRAGSLAANENSFGPSPKVAEAILSALSDLHRYPDPLATELRERLAAHHGVAVDQVLVGAGSEEFFFSCSSAYANHGRVAHASPGYWGHKVPGRLLGAELIAVPQKNWTTDLVAMAEVEADLIYVCGPHNPTGTMNTPEELTAFVGSHRSGIALLDEAYIDYAPAETQLVGTGLVASGRCAVLRTFSKFFGLAGLRVGWFVGPSVVVSDLLKVRSPFPVSGVSQAAGLAALDDVDHQRFVREATARNKAAMLDALASVGLATVPSSANFAFVPLSEAAEEDRWTTRLRAGGVSVRSGVAFGAGPGMRITVPDDEGLALLEAALASAN